MLHENWALMPWVDSNYCRPRFQGSNQPRRPGGFILIFVSKYEMIIQTDSKGGWGGVIWAQKAFVGLVNSVERVCHMGS